MELIIGMNETKQEVFESLLKEHRDIQHPPSPLLPECEVAVSKWIEEWRERYLMAEYDR